MRFEDTVAVIWVRFNGHDMELAVDPVTDRIPYDRPLLARCLHRLATAVEEAEPDLTTPPTT